MSSTRAVYKYPLPVGGGEILMPTGAEILTVQVQHGTPCIWALVDPSLQEGKDPDDGFRHFVTYGTGHTIRDGERLKYIGTFQLESGQLVFHVFEELQAVALRPGATTKLQAKLDQKMREVLAAYEGEHGKISEEEMEEARARWRLG